MNSIAAGARLMAGAAFMGLTAACVRGQVPVDHRPPADTIISGILDQGAVDLWARHADFQGCPQSDPLGQELLTGLDPSGLTDWAIGDLAVLWADELATCEHPPLEDWYRSILSKVVSAVRWSSVLAALPTPLPQTLRDELLVVANSPGTAEGTSAAALGRLSADLSGVARIDFFLTQANSGVAPDGWVFYEVQFLFDNFGTTYVNAVAQAAPTLNATIVHYAAHPALAAVYAGILSGGDPSVVALISALESRSELGYLYDSFIAAQARFLLDAM
jgi:hypothetical protein